MLVLRLLEGSGVSIKAIGGGVMLVLRLLEGVWCWS